MVLHDSSKYIYNWLKSQPFVKEESITDWLLFFVSTHSDKIIYKTFSHNEEAFNGSDWEWWILTETYAFRFLIQAKKLKENADNYPNLSYNNRHGMQIDLLINSASQKGAMPFYAFYSCQKPEIEKQINNISYIDKSALEWCKPCINGCFLSSAHWIKEKILDAPRKRISEIELVNASFGISIFDFYTKKTIKEVTNILLNLNSYYRNQFNNEKGIAHLFRDIPSYVRVLIENKNNNQQSLSWYESEFGYYLSSLSGISIIDLRN